MPGHLTADIKVRKQSGWRSLCKLARRGDADAFGEICERLRPHLLHIADRDLGKDLLSKVAAADIVQVSMLEALGGFDHFVGESEADFRAWVERILSNNLIDVARVYHNCDKCCITLEIPIDAIEDNQEMIDCCKTASSIVSGKEAGEELLRFVARLPERRRRVVEMRFCDGMSHAEIGDQLLITEAAARKILSRAIIQLRSMLSGKEDVVRPNRPR
jgi:RNA polymerase sigma-70 factor (subfamily 1)